MHGFLILSPNQMNHGLSCFLYIFIRFLLKTLFTPEQGHLGHFRRFSLGFFRNANWT